MNDLKHGYNTNARNINYHHALKKLGYDTYTEGHTLEPTLKSKDIQKYQIYEPNNDNNYWSYYKNHKTSVNKGNYVSKRMFKANEKVLEHHGVYSGINFRMPKHKHNFF